MFYETFCSIDCTWILKSALRDAGGGGTCSQRSPLGRLLVAMDDPRCDGLSGQRVQISGWEFSYA